MKQIVVNKNVCIGCGACVAIAKDNFNFDENGLSSVISNENIEGSNVQEAIDACPTSAISITEKAEETCECEKTEECTCGDTCACTGCHHECMEEEKAA